jgi:membrane protein implicated in regulation of membrane protease activity
MDAYQISLIISVVLAIAEVMTLSFILLGFSIGMLVVSGVQYVFDGYNLNRDVMVFAVVSVVSFVVLRKVFKKNSDVKRLAEDDINQY